MSNIFSKLLDESDRQRQQLRQLDKQSETKSTSIHQETASPVTSVEPSQRGNDEPSPRLSVAPTLVQQVEPTNRQSDAPTLVQKDVPTEIRSDKTTSRRATERVAFDLYQDQAQAIRRLRATRELSGERRVSLSDIAREAFDLFLKNNR